MSEKIVAPRWSFIVKHEEAIIFRTTEFSLYYNMEVAGKALLEAFPPSKNYKVICEVRSGMFLQTEIKSDFTIFSLSNDYL